MADRFSTAVKTALAAIEATDESAAPATLRLEFAQPDGVPAVVVAADTAGASVTPVEAKDEPTLSLANSIAGTAAADQKFIAVSLDPDAPFPSFPFLGPIIHGVQTDLTLKGTAAEGWTLLSSESTPLVSYIKPGPPPPSSAHRYVFVLWKQPAELDTAAIRKKMGWPADGVSRLGRMRFDVNTLEQQLGLGAIVAINFFRSQQ